MNNKITVLVLEHNPEWMLSIRNFYTDIIKACGYDSEFIFIAKAKGEIIEAKNNATVFDRNEIDLFVSDLSLGDDEGTFLGLHVIKKIKEEFPELVVIANSSQPVSTQEISQQYPSFDLYVDKASFMVEKYKIYIAKLLDKILNRNIYLTIDSKESRISPVFHFDKPSQKNKLINLLKFITFNSRERENSVTRVILTSIEDGNSASFVFQMDGYLDNGLKCINSIIKISNKEKSRAEKQNYDRFVKWNLPYTWRVELLSYAEWQDLGCICYSYAFADNSKSTVGTIKSATDYIEINNEDKILDVLDTIFNPKNVTWYSPQNIGIHSSITNYYYTRWFENRKSPVNSIVKIVENNNGKLNANRIFIGKYNIPRPEGFLNIEKGKCMTCICHGDLNSNNILFSDNASTPVFIDFQDTGRGHVFVDFIVFESSLRLYFNQKKTLEELIVHELELNKIIEQKDNANWKASDFKMYDIVLKLRRSAFETFPLENKWTYIYGLAMSAYARLRNFEKLQPWQTNQIFALMFSAINTLSRIQISESIKIESGNKFKIFASFNSVSREFVKKVVNDLGHRGIIVWLDENQLLGGDNFVEKLQEIIKQAKIFLVFIGETEGPWQSHEIHQIIVSQVRDKSKLIIPCIVPDTIEPQMPGFLTPLTYIDFNTNYSNKIIELAERVNKFF